jgi:CBS domain-containing protein
MSRFRGGRTPSSRARGAAGWRGPGRLRGGGVGDGGVHLGGGGQRAARRIGAVVVSSDGKTAKGILSERDIVRELGKSGAACLSANAGAIMTAEIVGCSLSDTSDACWPR